MHAMCQNCQCFIYHLPALINAPLKFLIQVHLGWWLRIQREGYIDKTEKCG